MFTRKALISGEIMSFTSYSIDNDNAFQNALDRALRTTKDLSIPLTQISKDFYRGQRAIFTLKGPGQYPDLAPSTKNAKFRDFGFRYPILKRTGKLAKSMTDPKDQNAINIISNKRSLFLGTQVEYGIYHQSDRPRNKIPLRKFIFIGPEAPRFAKGRTAGRVTRWNNILNSFVLNTMKKQGFKVS